MESSKRSSKGSKNELIPPEENKKEKRRNLSITEKMQEESQILSQMKVSENLSWDFLMLMQKVQSEQDIFSDFDQEDLTIISNYLKIVDGEKGDIVVKKGEISTFCAIVLDGKLLVDLPHVKNKVFLGRGSMLGEQQYFEGGLRSATVIVEETSIIGVLEFSALRKLNDENPIIGSKLIEAFAVSSINVLKKILGRPPEEQSVDPLVTQMNMKKLDPNTRHQLQLSLTSKLSSSSREAEKKIEKEKQKRKLAEHAARTKEYAIQNRESHIKKLENDILEKDIEISILKKNTTNSENEIRSLKETIESLSEKCLKYENNNNKLMDEKSVLEKQINILSNKKGVDDSVVKLSTLQAELASLRVENVNLSSQLQEKEKKLGALEHQSKFLSARRDSAFAKIENVKVALGGSDGKNESLENLIKKHSSAVQKYEEQLIEQQKSYEELNKKFSENEKQLRDIEIRRREENQMKMHENLQRELDQLEKISKPKAVKQRKYADLLLNPYIFQYVRNWRLRKQMRLIHKILWELCCDVVMKLDRNLCTSQLCDLIDPLDKYPFSRGSIKKILKALVEQMDQFQELYAELVRQKSHWKLTCNNFFKHSVELRGEIMNLQNKVEKLAQKNKELKKKLDDNELPNQKQNTNSNFTFVFPNSPSQAKPPASSTSSNGKKSPRKMRLNIEENPKVSSHTPKKEEKKKEDRTSKETKGKNVNSSFKSTAKKPKAPLKPKSPRRLENSPYAKKVSPKNTRNSPKQSRSHSVREKESPKSVDSTVKGSESSKSKDSSSEGNKFVPRSEKSSNEALLFKDLL